MASEYVPWRTAFLELFSFPDAVLGPVDWRAFWRLALVLFDGIRVLFSL